MRAQKQLARKEVTTTKIGLRWLILATNKYLDINKKF